MGQSSSALADPSNPRIEPDNDIDLSYLENVMATIVMDPSIVERSFRGDSRFWFPHQADWYESVIMTKKHVTTEMKWIDWNYFKGLA